MEDMARLALVEHNVKDLDIFYQILQELLSFINQILENPHENEFRKMKSHVLRMCFTCEAFTDYLKYIGLHLTQNDYIYPKEQTLSRLRMSQAAIERKIGLCRGSTKCNKTAGLVGIKPVKKREKLTPSFIEIKLHPMLVDLRTKFNDMLKYEDDDLLQMAREQIPIVYLQSMAMTRMLEHQKKIKTGESKDPEMSFDVALLSELIGWFKYSYFSWVDKPPCDNCGGITKHISTAQLGGEAETCAIELYKCTVCTKGARFPRYNNPAMLLRTRRGRCGEWANCFTLFCRTLGYDTRCVYDDQDHVWCEVFDYDSNTWLHADPCEATINAPLMYCHGWKKTLSYVFAFSRDDLQDVTWRYTMNHKEVRKRRTVLSEADLLQTMVALRTHRHAQLTPARRRYLAARTIHELADLMRERKPTDYESRGRTSGARAWRAMRGEIASVPIPSYSFGFTQVGIHVIRYHTSLDLYRIYTNGVEMEPVHKWHNAVYELENIFRNVEEDWRRVYLARDDGESPGTISWCFTAVGRGLVYKSISVKALTNLFETGRIVWSIQFDSEVFIPFEIGELGMVCTRDFTKCILRARLSGGRGDVAWQHAQLFRTVLNSSDYSFEVMLQMDFNDRVVNDYLRPATCVRAPSIYR